LQVAEDLVQTIINRLQTVPGVVDADASNRERRPQQNIQFDRKRMAQLGLSVQDVAAAIQTSVGGRRAGVYRISGEEIDINDRLRPENRLRVVDLDNISVRTAEGILPISALVTQEMGRGPSNINRIDGQRINYIYANLEAGLPLGEDVERVR